MDAADAARSRHRLEPHRLPYAGRGDEHNPRRIERLFPTRFAAAIHRTINAYDQLLRAAIGQKGSDVITERIVTAGVNSQILAVDINLRAPVDGIEMQKNSLTCPFCWHCELASIPGKR